MTTIATPLTKVIGVDVRQTELFNTVFFFLTFSFRDISINTYLRPSLPVMVL